MSYCPATTSTTILSLCNFCLRSNKLLLNSLHSLETCSTYVCAEYCFERLALRLSTLGVPSSGSERVGAHKTRTVDGAVTGGKNCGLSPRAAVSHNMVPAPQPSLVHTGVCV